MQENKDRDYSADPSQVSESAEGDSSSVFLNSSKLRTKLEKLAKWRIDPSLIEFPGDTSEFRGGYATVSRAFLASSSSTEGVRNEPEHTTNEYPDPDAGNPRFQNDTQERKFDQQGKDEQADSRTADKDHTEAERRNASDTHEEQPESYRSTFASKVDDGPESSKLPAREDPDSGDRNARPQRDTQDPGDDPQGKDEGIDSRTIDGDNDETQEERRDDSNNDEDHKSRPKASVSTIEDRSGSGSPSPQSQRDTQEPGDDRKHNDEGPGSPIADGENDQTKGEHKSDRQTSEPKIVAIKKLKVEEDTDPKRVLGLALRESEFLVGLSHPNIVKFEGFVEDLSTQKVWLIFPWEEHGNLRDFLASGEWEIPERISLINDVTLGLEYLHSQQPPIYHGDLKSLNVLISSEFHALITDFGSARHLGSDYVSKQPKENNAKVWLATDPKPGEEHITLGAFFSATATTLTLTGSSYTLRWAAPELLQEDKPCLRSDIWSLGWIAYEVMTNTIPFHDIKKDAIVINRVIQGHLPSVTEDARMSLIRALCSLMLQCWSIDPEKRPTAEECRKSISWMPMIVPIPTQGINEDASSVRSAQLLGSIGQMYKRQGDYYNAFDCFTKAMNIYTINNDSQGKASNLCSLANLHLYRGEHAEAESLYTEALQIFTESGNQVERADAILGLAEVYRFQDKYDKASRLYSECLQIYTNIGARPGKAYALSGLAGVHVLQEEYSEAEALYSEALVIATDVGDQREAATLVWNLAEVHRLRKEYSEARKLYSEALQMYTDIGDTQGRGTALWGLGRVHQVHNESSEAIKLGSEAVQIFTDIGDNYWRADALTSLARAHQMENHYSEAISLYTEASGVLEEIGDAARASNALENAAHVRRTLEKVAADSTEAAETKEDPILALE